MNLTFLYIFINVKLVWILMNSIPIPTPQDELIPCGECGIQVSVSSFTEHLLDNHARVTCQQCDAEVIGEIGLLHHIED